LERSTKIASGTGGSPENRNSPAVGPTVSADDIDWLAMPHSESRTKNFPTLGILQGRISRERGRIGDELREPRTPDVDGRQDRGEAGPGRLTYREHFAMNAVRKLDRSKDERLRQSRPATFNRVGLDEV